MAGPRRLGTGFPFTGDAHIMRDGRRGAGSARTPGRYDSGAARVKSKSIGPIDRPGRRAGRHAYDGSGSTSIRAMRAGWMAGEAPKATHTAPVAGSMAMCRIERPRVSIGTTSKVFEAGS